MAGEGKNKAAINEEEDSENWCFVCKDGGDLRICDFRQCVKSYHPECVGKNDSFLKSKRDWNCPWHKCYRCVRSSYLRCYTCCKATCRPCLPATRILKVKGAYGFCKHCLKLVLLIEEKKECDSDGDYVDFTDPDTAEGLFMEYYTIIKNNEGFKLRDIYAAKGRVSSVKKNDPPKSVPDIFDQEYDSSDVRVENSKHEKRRKSSNGQKPEKRSETVNISRVYDHLKEYFAEDRNGSEEDKVGDVPEASKGQRKADVEKQNEKKEAENNQGFELRDIYAAKESVSVKKNDRPKSCSEDFDCREVRVEKSKHEKRRRRSNGQKPEKCNKKVFIEGDNVGPSNAAGAVNASKRQRKADVEEKNEEKEAENNKGFELRDKVGCVPGPSNAEGAVNTLISQIKADVEEKNEEKEAVKDDVRNDSRLASIEVENMKMLYLRRSVLQEMLKEPESFVEKAVGCFVQLRPPTKAYQLIRIIGVKTLSTDETETVLLLSEEPTEMKISLLADTDPEDVSSRGEFDPLMGKFLAGEIERPTVAYIQQKARSLHKDTINVMIRNQLLILRHRVDKANEMGKKHLYPFAEYEQDKQRLESPAEYSRLLQNVPTVIPDMSEPAAEDCKSGGSEHQNINESEENAQHTSQSEQREPLESERREIEVIDVTIEDEVEDEVNPEHEMLCVKGPAGERNMLPLCILRKWSAVSTYSAKFVVWKEDGREEDAVPLPEVLTS